MSKEKDCKYTSCNSNINIAKALRKAMTKQEKQLMLLIVLSVKYLQTVVLQWNIKQLKKTPAN